MSKRRVTISMDTDAYQNLDRLVRSPLTVSGVLNLAAGALTRENIASLVYGEGFHQGASFTDELWNLLCEHEREIRRRIGEYPRNVPEEDARREVLEEVGEDHWTAVRELIMEIQLRVRDEINAEERV